MKKMCYRNEGRGSSESSDSDGDFGLFTEGGVGLAICDRGICFCMGKNLEVEKRKDWDRMEGYYDFEGNRGWCWKLTQGLRSQSQTMRLGARLPPDGMLYTILLWGRGQSCLCRKTSTPAKKNMATMIPWNPSPIISHYPTSATGPLSHIWNYPWASLYILSSSLCCHHHYERSCCPH